MTDSLTPSPSILIRLHRPEGYEDVHPEIILDDLNINPAFRPELVAAAGERVPHHLVQPCPCGSGTMADCAANTCAKVRAAAGFEAGELISALAACRDAFPVPERGSATDNAWVQAMGDPLSVPAFVRAALAAPVPADAPQPAKAAEPELLEACKKAVEWLEGWASADPYVSILRAAIAKAEKAACPAPVEPSELLEAVDSLLETAPCDCSHKRRYENGEHLSGCYLFDLNIARGKTAAASASPASQPPATLPESMSRDEMLKYYSDYANMIAAEVVVYQKQIRELKAAQAAASPAVVQASEPSADAVTRAFFQHIAQSKEASVAFLQEAGILDERGELAEPYRAAKAAEPLDVPLPCDVKVGHNTFRKGVSLSTFVEAARRWHREAFPEGYTLTDEQKAANLAILQGVADGEPAAHHPEDNDRG